MLAGLLLAVVSTAATQEVGGSTTGLDLAVKALWSHQQNQYSADQRTVGVGVDFGYLLPVGLAVELRGSYRSWEWETYVPLHLGMRYDLSVSSDVTFAPFAGVGPSLVWGGDWGSVFASFDLGARTYVSPWRGAGVRLMVEVSYGRGLAFHPDAFGVITLGGGVVFSM